MSNFLSLHPDGELDILSFAGKDASAEFDMFHPLGVIVNFVPCLSGRTSCFVWCCGKDCAKANKNRRDRMDGYRKVEHSCH